MSPYDYGSTEWRDELAPRPLEVLYMDPADPSLAAFRLAVQAKHARDARDDTPADGQPIGALQTAEMHAWVRGACDRANALRRERVGAGGRLGIVFHCLPNARTGLFDAIQAFVAALPPVVPAPAWDDATLAAYREALGAEEDVA